jgi:hypothetical protein
MFSTTQTCSTATLSQPRYSLASSSIGEIVAFGGGLNVSSFHQLVMCCTTHRTVGSLSISLNLVIGLHQHPLKTKYSLEVVRIVVDIQMLLISLSFLFLHLPLHCQ